MRNFYTLCLLTGVLAVASHAAEGGREATLPPPSSQAGVTFDKDIKPLFEKACFKCHGPEKSKGKLRVDSLAAIQKGSEHGKILETGKSATSKLVLAVARVDKEEAMPPKDKGNPLTKDEVGLIRAWIDQGTK